MKNKKTLIINKKKIFENSLPYMIAEIGVNHENSLLIAKKMINQAKISGFSAVKFQTYKAENLVIKNSPAYWDLKKEKTKSQFKLFKKYDKFDKKDYFKLYNYCKKIKIDFLSTPFDIESIDWLAPLMPAIKIASADINNFPLLRKIGSIKKPIFLSTGASNISEIKNALKVLHASGAKDIVIMHCILNYPTLNENANLNMILNLKKEFPNNIIGYSDHTLPKKIISPCVIAYQLGARVIEKHFTYNKKLKGNDHYHAIDKNDATEIISQIIEIKKILGNSKIKNFLLSEIKSRKYARRSIVTKVNIKKGDVFSETNLTTKRPGTGINPMFWNKIIGKKSKDDINADIQIKKKNF